MRTFFYSCKQSGASLVEFTIIAIPVLSLLLGSIEATQWYFARQAISLALLESARSASTNHNNPQTIINSFEDSLKPLFISPNEKQNKSSFHNVEQALNQRQKDNGLAPWQIKVLSPSKQAFKYFKDKSIKNFNGLAAINNNYLELQNANVNTKTNSNIDNKSTQDIFQANTLSLSLTWQHKPYLPLIKPILRAMGDKNGDYKRRALYSGYIPIQREISMLMHSHPVQWPNHPSGKVIFDWEFNNTQCQDWLCNHSYSFNPRTDNSFNTGNSSNFDSNNNQNKYDNNNSELKEYIDNLLNNNADRGDSDFESDLSKLLSQDEYEQLCGVTLCCIDWD